jgi:hypothetical protein
MQGPRTSIAGLMALIALLGVTFSALHAVTEFSASAVLTLTPAASGAALLGRLSTRSTDKEATWTDYLVFGTGYLAMCVGPRCDEHLMPNLVTTQLIDERYSNMEYAPKHAGERVWTSDGTGLNFAAGEVFSDVNAQTVSFDDVHAASGATFRYAAAQIRPISPNGYRRLWNSALSVWLGLPGMGFARYVFLSGQDRSVRRRGMPSVPPT